MPFTERDIIQVAAFHAIHKGLKRDGMKSEDALCQAVALTSDEKWDIYSKNNPDLIERWRREFGTKGRRRKRKKELPDD